MEAENSASSADLDTGWRGSARDLAENRGWNFRRAFDWELVRCLMEGDSRPLLDLILRQNGAPGVRVTQYIAAMIDRRFRVLFPDPIFPYELRLAENRGRGRPRKGSAATAATKPNLGGEEKPIGPSAVESCQEPHAGLRAIGEGRRPARPFWLVLAAALDFDGYKRDKGKDFPLKAKLVRTDGRKGRRKDPELFRRDLALAAAVSEKRERGAKYDEAVEEVRAEIEKQGKGENWRGWIETQTIRDAYDGVCRKIAALKREIPPS